MARILHIATHHFRTARWIDVQLSYLERHTREPYRVYACLEGVDRRCFDRFPVAIDARDVRADPADPRDLAEVLDFLAAEMIRQAAADELIVFLHGDAFPIADWVGPVREMVKRRGLAGVRRDENQGEPHPHPLFTATTPRLWEEIGATWDRGPTWVGTDGREVTDWGAVLLERLREAGVDWRPMLRSNAGDLHPLWFGVYEDLVYHHGAGFRPMMSRLDASEAPPRDLLWAVPHRLAMRLRARRSARIGKRLFRKLERDEEFWREL